MARMNIVSVGSPVLTRPSKEADILNWPRVSRIVRACQAALKAEPGAMAVAAPQIGRNVTIFVWDTNSENEFPGPGVAINPDIISASPEMEDGPEGCLSMPGRTFWVPRHREIAISAIDQHGDSYQVEAESLFARLIQHEIDHLEGLLINDYPEVGKSSASNRIV